MNKKLSKIYSNSILLGKFDFNPEEFLDKSILFDLKKQTSKEQIFDAILEKIPNNEKYYIEYQESTNALQIRKDEDKNEKDTVIAVVDDLNKKINKTTNKSKLSQLKRTRNKHFLKYW